MELITTMPEDQLQRAVEWARATGQGTTLEEIAQLAFSEKLSKLFYSWRSNQRKPPRAKYGRPGRPPLTQQTRQCRELGKALTKIYSQLGKENPQAFEALHRVAETELYKAIKSEDLHLLRWFDEHKPWATHEPIPLYENDTVSKGEPTR